jgi:hypothetical protein
MRSLAKGARRQCSQQFVQLGAQYSPPPYIDLARLVGARMWGRAVQVTVGFALRAARTGLRLPLAAVTGVIAALLAAVSITAPCDNAAIRAAILAA